MFTSISWQEFFLIVAVLIGGYYGITTLLLYWDEITSIFNQRKLTRSSQDTKQDQRSTNESDLMGGVRYNSSKEQLVARESTTSADELTVAPSQEVEEPVNVIDIEEESLTNDFATLHSEINSLTEIVSQSAREESISLFKTLLSNYPQLIGNHYQQSASQCIYDSCKEVCPHHFELSEITSWWTNQEDNSIDNQ